MTNGSSSLMLPGREKRGTSSRAQSKEIFALARIYNFNIAIPKRKEYN
jgi:hypothetical protein